jgi:hypothetical protein
MTEFVASDDAVWGRPVGVAVAEDGSLLVSDGVTQAGAGAALKRGEPNLPGFHRTVRDSARPEAVLP